jgi:hypothetical protein
MSSQVEAVDLSEYSFAQKCDVGCGREATVIAQGCMDKEPTMMCNACLLRGLDLIRKAVDTYQRQHRRVMVCGDCHRPILNLETHLEIRKL